MAKKLSHQRIMQLFARWHIWLGWLVGVPILMWTVSGLVMAARPLAEVRGEHLYSAPAGPSIDPAELALPLVGEVADSIELAQQADGPVWIVTTEAGGIYRYAGDTGRLIPPVVRDEAIAIADNFYTGEGAFESLTFFSSDEEPPELRRGRSSWRIQYDDGVRVYVDNSTGQVLALRTGWWRTFDFMYGLHIMNLEERSDSHHPILIIFASLSVFGSLMGCILMFRRRKAKVKKPS